MKIIRLFLVSTMVLSVVGCSQVQESNVKKSVSTDISAWKYDGSSTTFAKQKDESVTVAADAYGHPEEITVDTTLSDIVGTGPIEEKTNLKNIVNKNGNESFEVKDGTIWFENLGKDISYSGTSDKDLPITLQVSYWLDGQEVQAEDIAGKSGHIKILLDYSNQTAYENVHIPFVCLSVLILGDSFSNVVVKNGKISKNDTTSIVMGLAMPSLQEDLALSSYEDVSIDIPNYVEVEPDTTNFSLDFIETLVSNSLFSELNKENLQDLEDMSDDFVEVGKIGNTLEDSGKQLCDGYAEIQSAIDAYLQGVEALFDGLQGLQKGADTLSNNTAQLVESANALKDALDAMDFSAFDNTSNAIIDDLKQDMQAIALQVQQLNVLETSLRSLQDKIDGILMENGEDESIRNDVQNDFASLLSIIYQISTSILDCIDDISTKMNSLDISQYSEVKQKFVQLQQVSVIVAQGTETLSYGLQQLDDGIEVVASSTQQAMEKNTLVREALQKFVSGLTKYQSGIGEMNATVLQKLKEKGKESGRLLSSIQQLRQAEKSYQTYTELLDGQSGSVTFLIETEKVCP